MTFPEQLKAERDRLGMTQAELAQALETSASWVDKAERDQRTPHILTQEGALARLKRLASKPPVKGQR